MVQSKLNIQGDVLNLKSRNMTSSRKAGHNMRYYYFAS